MKTVARVLSIAGSDSGGGAGIQADLKTITALGGYGMSVVTAVTAQNTLGVQKIHTLPVDLVEQQCRSVMTDIGVDAVKTGMLGPPDIVRAVARELRKTEVAHLVVDPVMIAKGGAVLLQEDARSVLVEELLPLAEVVTPNIPEAEVLAEMTIRTLDEMRQAARRIRQRGGRCVVVKGGHRAGDAAIDVLFDGKEFYEFRTPRIETEDTHGTGCTFSAAIATGLARGSSVYDAVRQAKDFITTAIRFGLRLGGGQGPANHAAALLREAERYQCLCALKQAIQRLQDGAYGYLIPEVQSNLGYALPYAESRQDVAAIPGRLVNVDGRIRNLCDPEFGASQHVAKIILAAMHYDSDYRSVLNIRFSEEMLSACQKAGLALDSFNRADEPKDVKLREGSSLEWGTQHTLSKRDDVPDIIFDRGDMGKEPMIRVLGKNPVDVVEKILRATRHLIVNKNYS